ncbi:MAG TPA: DNA translocase FtsK [Bacillota bacterium]
MKSWLRDLDEAVRRELLALSLLGVATLAFFALLAHNPGAVGGFLQRVLYTLFGRSGAIAVPVLVGLGGLLLLTGRQQAVARPRVVGVGLALMALLVYLHRDVPGRPAWAYVRNGWQHQVGGGLIGGLLTWALVSAFGLLGRDLVLALMVLLAIPLTFNAPLGRVVALLGRSAWHWARAGLRALRDFVIEEVPEAATSRRSRRGEAEASPVAAADGPTTVAVGAVDEPAMALEPSVAEGEGIPLDGPPVLHASGGPAIGAGEPKLFGSNGHGHPRSRPPVGDHGTADAGAESRSTGPAAATGPYRLPPLSLLQRGPTVRKNKNDRQAQAKAQQLEQTLASFGVEARVVAIQEGPAVTRFELEPAVGVRVSKIQNLASDIALSLAATDVRIEAPIPGKSRIGIEVPNPAISPVYLRDVLDRPEFRDNPSQLTIALGKDIAGQPIITSLERMVHLLIAGATGSGKSVCVNAILASLLFKAWPDQVKLMLIDPKMVELSGYNGIPHLIAPVITDPKRAASSLQWVVREMERRYHQFADAGVRDISRFNAQAEQAGGERLPYIVVVIDELADLMMVAPVDVEDAIQRLAQMARAAGIHLIVATQRPSVDVITGVIKANIPSRIAFAVSSQTDSRVILDMAGAEKLVGKGDMLFSPMGASKPIRVQGVYVSEAELEALLDFIRGQQAPTYDEGVLAATEQAGSEPIEGDDDLFPEAVRLVVEAGQASVSLLQRRLRIGYTRAGRLIDMMEERGFVGPHQGSKPRDVRLTMEEYRRLFES